MADQGEGAVDFCGGCGQATGGTYGQRCRCYAMKCIDCGGFSSAIRCHSCAVEMERELLSGEPRAAPSTASLKEGENGR